MIELLKNSNSPASKNISYLSHVIKVRSKLKAFHPEASMKCLYSNIDKCVSFQRGENEDSIYIFCNLSDESLYIKGLNEMFLSEENLNKNFFDNITGTYLNPVKLELSPYQVVWISIVD